ncbi:hypothetical protein [Streptomyces pseudogriseolus]|uniref:hypothetical protein n=1 Tax=Streptomyces pseudogriseolus TaxID=36817 RepID=UPI003FA1CA4F
MTSHHDLTIERERLRRRPSEEPISLLGLFVVTPTINHERYAERLRDVIGAAVAITRSIDFERDTLPIDLLPPWFLDLSSNVIDGMQSDPAGREGRRRYLEVREDRPWDAEEWLFCFDPDLRAWSWWDVTLSSHGSVCVWIDTRGEAHIPCEELWWAIFLAGAGGVEPFILENSTVWSGQPSVGL